MAVKYMGFEGKIYYGAAGSTAATEITNSRDITYTLDTEKGDTTERGSGASPPIETGRVTSRILGINFQMLNKASDTTLAALLTAAYAGTAVAIRTIDKTAGKGFDGDVYLKVEHGKPLKGEQTFDFSTDCITDENRTPVPYV